MGYLYLTLFRLLTTEKDQCSLKLVIDMDLFDYYGLYMNMYF